MSGKSTTEWVGYPPSTRVHGSCPGQSTIHSGQGTGGIWVFTITDNGPNTRLILETIVTIYPFVNLLNTD